MKSTSPQDDAFIDPERKKIHELTAEELDNYYISEHSQFKDSAWYRTNPTPGSTPSRSTLNWTMTLFDGSKATDAQHAARLHWAKILALTLLVSPLNGRPLGPGSMSLIQRRFQWLLSWMSDAGYRSPCELTPIVIGEYLNQLPMLLAAQSADGEVGHATAALTLDALKYLWDQRRALAKMGVESLPRHPFGGKSVSTIARSLCTKANGWVKPLPDEVAIPMFNKAAWFLGSPADDVIRLLDVVRDPLADTEVLEKIPRNIQEVGPKLTGQNAARLNRAMEFLASFQFSVPDGSSEPWHVPLNWEFELSSDCRGARLYRIRELWEAVRDSAAIIVQGTSGMRLSELLGILAGTDDSTGLPIGVRIELSATGLYEWFVLRSVLSKAEEGLPREVDWVLGMRPVGSKEIPWAVRALQVLNQIHEPWRATATTDRLILAGGPGFALPTSSARRGCMHSDAANETMKRFIDRWVDLANLPDESARKTSDNDLVVWRECKGTAFRTHMLRKAWAQFALACDSRLLPVIQMQFHHLSLAMTESGYIGQNPLLLTELDSISMQKTNLAIFEIIIGRSKVAGRMGEQLEQALEKQRSSGRELPTSKRWQQAVEWTECNDLKMFFTPHATCCPTRTSEMRCHDASNTPIWLRAAPNPMTREPSLCAGCSCAIMDKSHESFWSDRYVGYEVSLRQAKSTGAPSGPFREIRFRADQARTILKKLGAELVVLDARVASTLKSHYAKT